MIASDYVTNLPGRISDPWTLAFDLLPDPTEPGFEFALPRPFKPGTMPVPIDLAAHEPPPVARAARVAHPKPPAMQTWGSALRAFRRMPRRLSRVAAW